MSDETRAGRASRILARWGGPVGIALALIGMAALTWRGWPDPIVDFGRELYVPWRISEGQTLYAEIAYHNGPLSPHLNAAWFGLAGVSLMALATLNLLIVLGVTVLLHRLLEPSFGRLAAGMGCLTWVVLFAFGQFTWFGNYNWVCPYSHELTHGIALSLLGLVAARRWAEGGSNRLALAAGLLLGLVFLTKAEVFVACFASLVVAGVLGLRASRRPARPALLAFAGGALAPILVAFVLLSLAMPASQALTGTLGTWPHALGGSTLEMPFFRQVSGLDDPGGNTLRMIGVTLAYAGVLGVLGGAGLLLARKGVRTDTTSVVLGALIAVALAVSWEPLPWQLALRGLPLVILILFAARLRSGWPDPQPEQVLPLALLTFAGLLLLKIVLNVGVAHYGFALAMPAAVVAVAALVGWAPRWLERRGAPRRPLATAAGLLVIGVLAAHLPPLTMLMARKRVEVGEGGDAFRADVRGEVLAAAADEVERRLGPDQTLTTLVDCEMLNYLTRRRNPIPYGNFNPHQLDTFGEDQVIAALEATPPDFVAVVFKDSAQYGPRFFGTDYGQDLWAWIEAHYVRVAVIRRDPTREHRFGIVLLRRR